MDAYTQGWHDADEAIQHKLPGYQDYSQGTSEWDLGWNARMSFADTSVRKSLDAATRDAIVLLRHRVQYGSKRPNFADAVLLNAALHLEGREVSGDSAGVGG